MTSADRRLQRPDVEIDTPLPRSESNEHVSASCHCHPLSITVGWPQTPSSPIRNQSRGRFESNLPCAPHPANGAQSAHIWLPIWLCLGHSVGKVISLRAPATRYSKITSIFPACAWIRGRGTGIMTAPPRRSRHILKHHEPVRACQSTKTLELHSRQVTE